jgi:signal transduction histidine kinase
MLRATLTGLDKRRLRLWLALFFLTLIIPTAVLIHQAYTQLKWEVFHQHQVLAEELASRIDGRFRQLIKEEESRSFADYSFLVVAGDPSASFLQRSPLSNYPPVSAIPGLIGYFQIGTHGAFSTPLVPQAGTQPANLGISPEQLIQREMLAERMLKILSENRLVQRRQAQATPAPPVSATRARRKDAATDERRGQPLEQADVPVKDQVEAQAAFDQLSKALVGLESKQKREAINALGSVAELNLDSKYLSKPTAEPQQQKPPTVLLEKRAMRKERSALPELPEPDAAPMSEEKAKGESLGPSRIRIHAFESEIDPFEFSLLKSGHFVLFRKVWRDGQRYIQGALIEQQPFLRGVVEPEFRETALSQMSDLAVAYQGRVFAALSGQASRPYLSSTEELQGALLYQTRLSAPLADVELIFSVNRLPAGPGGRVIAWVAAILMLVLCGGFYLMYRLAVGQIDLARQQQDFVSAVSHELKTPLTSIRMYGEMLRAGWVPEERKKTYYDYIHDESERLSRLIANVLQLARMTRHDLRVDPRPVSVVELMDGIRSKVSSQIERAGFQANIDCQGDASRAMVHVDMDFFTQIIINLVDNAIKFSAKAENKAIDILCRIQQDHTVVFSVRDYGPGVPRDQMKKIFKLFYRSENELTRETMGTGIGLALVNQLALSMGGQVDVMNQNPGAEFRVAFPVTS